MRNLDCYPYSWVQKVKTGIAAWVFVILALFTFNDATAQCTWSGFSGQSQLGYGFSTACNGGTYSRNVGSGTYTNAYFYSGNTYKIETCSSGFDTQLNIFDQNPAWTRRAQNDDNGPYCSGTRASIRYTSTYTGRHLLVVNRYNCQGHDFTGQSAILRVGNEVNALPSISGGGGPFCQSSYTFTRTGSVPGSHIAYWQTSSGGTSTGNSNTTYTVSGTGTQTVYLRYRSSSGCWGPARSATVTLESTSGTAGTFGNNSWYVSCYNGNNFDTYYGFYTDNNLSFDSANRWGTGSSPSSANGSGGSSYSGCTIPADQHSYIYKRQGFPCDRYSLSIPTHDDQVYVYVNGSLVFQNLGCCASHSNIWTGNLNSSSTIEYRIREGSGGSRGALTVADVSGTLSGGTISGGGTGCTGWNPPTTGNSASAANGAPGYTYVWQYRNGTSGTFIDIGSTNSTTYNIPALTTTRQYRREVTDACGNVAYSNILTYTITSDPSVSASGSTTICSGGNATVSASGSGGSGSSSYQWQISTNNSTWSNISGATGSSYNTGALTATRYYRALYNTSNGGCDQAVSSSVTVTVVADPSVSISGGATVCVGGSTGLTSSVSGGTGSTSYQWQISTDNSSWSNISGATSSTYNTGGLSATRYYRLVYNRGGNGCNQDISNTQTVTVVPDPSISASGGTTLCSGGSTTLSSSTSGGTGTLGYQWQISTNNSTWSNISGATSSTYNTGALTATRYYRVQRTASGSGCGTATSNSVTVTVEPDPSVSINQSSQSICYNSGVSFTSSVSGGTGSASYQWQISTNGSTWSNISGATGSNYNTGNLTATRYYRLQYDRGGVGCDQATSSTVQITVPSQLTLGASSTSSTCGNSNGEACVTVSGGTTPYAYAWSGGGSSSCKSSVPAGSYTVTVTDGLGCTATLAVGVTDIGSPSASITGQTDLDCFGDTDGNFTINFSGGTGPYVITWNPGGTTQNVASTGTYTSPSTFGAGSVSASVRDANNCVVSASTVLTEPADLTISLTSKTDVLCFGDNTGAIDVTVAGGTAGPGFTYSWSPGGYTTPDITGVPAGTYTLVVNDNNGCTASFTETISQPAAALTATSTTVNIDCNGNTIGEIDVTPAGGTTPYTYAWSHGPVSQDVTGLAAGTYTVTITDANLCSVTETRTITEPTTLVLNVNSTNDVACFGDASGSFTISGSGGAGGYQYSVNGSAYTATTNYTGLTAGAYNVILRDANNCTASTTINIDQPAAALSITVVDVTDIDCNGNAAGAIDISVSGGTANYTYNWSGPSGTFSTQDLSNILAGTYNVTVTDAQSCTETASVTVNQNVVLSATASVSDVTVCFGNNDGAITFTPSGGSGSYEFSIDGGTTYQANPAFTGLTAGVYDAYIKDVGVPGTCEVQLPNVTVNQPAALPAPSLPGGNSYTSCGLLLVNANAGAGADKCILYNSIPAPGLGLDTSSTFVFNNLPTGTYTYYVTSYDEATDCESPTYTTFTIDVVNPVLITGNITDVSCYGDGNGAIDITVTGGTPPYTYAWSNGPSTQDQSGLSGGFYNVVVTDVTGCFNIRTFNVVEFAPLTAALNPVVINGFNVKCNGEASGTVAIDVNGGDGNYTYTWNDANTDNPRFNMAAGSYSVTVEDGNGCSVARSINMFEPPALNLSLVTSYQCSGGGYSSASVDLIPAGGQAPYRYCKNCPDTLNATFQASSLFSNLPDGAVDTFVVYDANGCRASVIANITLPSGNQPVGSCDFIYVAPATEGGDANNAGTPDCPTTLTAAMNQVTSTRKHVRMLGGAAEYFYSSPVELVDDVIIEGGYLQDASGDWYKSSTATTTINFDGAYLNPTPGIGLYAGLVSTNVSGWSVIDVTLKVQLTGAVGTQDGAGRSVVGVLINNGSSNYKLNRVDIQTGSASAGLDGTDGALGANGFNGGNGEQGLYIDDQTGGTGPWSGRWNPADAGAGGDGGGANGGDGSPDAVFGSPNANQCQPYGAGDLRSGGGGGAGGHGGPISFISTAEPGFTGSIGGNGGWLGSGCSYNATGAAIATNNSPGLIWDFYNQAQPAPVAAGANGNDGADGADASVSFAPGAPGSNNTISEFYIPGSGASGGDGFGGSGGSGGGGTGAVIIDGRFGSPQFVNRLYGSSGGAGGGGGQGGQGGQGGFGGGSAFGIFVSSTSTTGADIQHVTISALGSAGAGGDGGDGGTGGVGGFGGSGGGAVTDTALGVLMISPAGNGGLGGDGGDGGRGQDGDDGITSSIYFGGAAAPVQTAAGSNGTVTINAVQACTNSEIFITKTSSDNWGLLTGEFVPDVAPGTSNYDVTDDSVLVYYTSTGAKDLAVGATTYSSLVIISGTRNLPVQTSAPYSTICQGGTVNLTTNTPGLSYRWAISELNSPTNVLFTSTNQNVNNLVIPVSGDFLVSLQVREECCGFSIPVYDTITVSPLPDTIPSIAGVTAVCSGEQGVTFTAPLSNNAAANVNTSTGYLWTVPAGATITSTGGDEGVVNTLGGTVSITVDFGSTAGDVTVTPSNSCGDGATTSKAITISPSPFITAISGSNVVCNGSSEILTPVIAGGSGSFTYSWSPGGQTTPNITVSPTVPTTYGVTVTDQVSGCSHSATKSITIESIPSAANPVSGDVSVVATETGVTYTTTPIAGANSYNWTVPAGATITSGQGTTTITVDWGTTSGNVTVAGVNVVCSGTPASLAVTVTSPPLVWNGNVSNNWGVASNWTPNQVPTATDVVLIPSGRPNYPADYGAAPVCAGLYVESGASVTLQGGFDMNVSGDLDIKTGATLNFTPVGAVEPTLSVDGNVDFNGTYGSAIGRFRMNGTAPQTFSGVMNTFHDFDVDNSAGVSVTTPIYVQGALELTSGVLTSNGNVMIKSDASGTGLVNDFTAGKTGSISGDIIVQRYVPAGSTGFHHISSPVDNLPLATELAELSLYGANNAQILPLPSCDPLNVSPFSPYGNLMEWREDASFVFNCTQSGWFVRSGGLLQNARGYAAIFGSATSSTTIDVAGTANTGSYSYTNLSNTNSTGNGWHLAGNPFPSPINWTAPTGFNPAAQIWHPSGPFANTYQPIMSGTGTSIAAMQGFFVKVIGSGPSTFTLDNSDRTTTPGSFMRQSSSNESELKIQIDAVSGTNASSDITRIWFNANNSDSYDIAEDGLKQKANTQNTLYTKMTANDPSIAFNLLGSLSTGNVKQVILGLDVYINGNYEFTFTEDVAFAPTAMIYLEDLKTGTIQNMRANNVYSFTADVNDDDDRFLIHFVPAADIAAVPANCDGLNGSINVDLGQYNVTNTTVEWDSYSVTDASSNVVASGTNVNGAINIPDLVPGNYTLTLDIDGYVATEIIEVTALATVEAEFIEGFNTAYTNTMIQFYDNSTGATSYAWDFGDGTPVSNLQDPSHIYAQAGTYDVVMTATNDDCTDTYSKKVTVEDAPTVGVVTLDESNVSILGFENRVTIIFSNIKQAEATLNIYDVVGRKVISAEKLDTKQSRHEITLNEIATGNYFVVVEAEGLRVDKKVFLSAEK